MFLKVTDLRKRYDGESIINKVSFTIGYSEKVGLIGKNGAGKSTLLQMIAGLIPPTSGHIQIDPPSMSMLYFHQVLMEEHEKIGDFIISSLPYVGEIKRKLNKHFSQELLSEYESRGGFNLESRIKATLGILSLSHITEDTYIKTLSGGEKTRLQLAPIILAKPDLLLLDEPTNHLDNEGLEFLENYIRQYKGIVITATHDKAFLQACCKRIMELENQKIFDIKGTMEIFLREKELARDKAEYKYKEDKRELSKLKNSLNALQDASFMADLGKGITRKDNDKMGFDFLAQKAAKKFSWKAEVVQKKISHYEENIEKPALSWKMKLTLADQVGEKLIYSIDNISKSFDDKKIITDFSKTIYSKDRIVLIGRNGSGKSTLIKLLVGSITPDKGSIKKNDTVTVSYLSQDHLDIDAKNTLLDDFLGDMEVEASVARTYLHQFLFTQDDVHREISSFSQGEKAKYAFAKLLLKKPQFLLLDEPSNYMDIQSKEIIESALKNFHGGFVIATHDRNLIQEVEPTEVISLDQ